MLSGSHRPTLSENMCRKHDDPINAFDIYDGYSSMNIWKVQAFFQKNPRFVGRAALPTPTMLDNGNAIQKDQPPNSSVIARPQAVAIRIPCDALHRPAPQGPERERIATGFHPRNDSSGRYTVLPFWLSSRPTWSAGAMPTALLILEVEELLEFFVQGDAEDQC